MALGDTLKQPINQLNVLGYRKACFVLMGSKRNNPPNFYNSIWKLKLVYKALNYKALNNNKRGVSTTAIPDERTAANPNQVMLE